MLLLVYLFCINIWSSHFCSMGWNDVAVAYCAVWRFSWFWSEWTCWTGFRFIGICLCFFGAFNSSPWVPETQNYGLQVSMPNEQEKWYNDTRNAHHAVAAGTHHLYSKTKKKQLGLQSRLYSSKNYKSSFKNALSTFV